MNRATILDGGCVLFIAAVICLTHGALLPMTVLVPAVFVFRMVQWNRLPTEEKHNTLLGELLFLALCTVLGGFNDWNTVVRHRVYDYTVQSDLGTLSSIPAWMLLYWGLILRFVVTLAHTPALGNGSFPRNDVPVLGTEDRTVTRTLTQLSLVLVTRQCIYRLSLHPLWSWLPFALALGMYLLVSRPSQREQRLALVFAIGGPLAEAALIKLGGLHSYALGWLLGVPLWIALWWVLAVLLFADLGSRIERWIATRVVYDGPSLR